MSFFFFFFFKYHSGGVQSSGPSSEPLSRGALRARLASVCDEGGTARRLPPGGRWTGRRECVRACLWV